MSNIYGYIRVSTQNQRDDRQRLALLNFGILEKDIFTDKQSGKDFNRPAYKKLLHKLKADDVLVIKSIDRLGRNYSEILEQWRIITKEKKAAIVVLDMPLLDTRREKDIMGTLIADLVLQIMSAFAQIERDFIRQRQREGIEAAKAKGVHFGRLPIPKPDNYNEVYQQWKNGLISARRAAKLLGVSHFTFLRWVKD